MSLTISNTFYNIYLDNSLKSLSLFLNDNYTKFSAYFILVDENTHQAAVPLLLSKVAVLQEASILELNAGEENKNLHSAMILWSALKDNNADRNTLIVNLGGGMLSDLGGFVASVYKRGVAFINVPTSLLAMTDAAIGSKTGVDYENAKNIIGSFSHPQGVFISTEFLSTMPRRELLSGMGEVLKYALISGNKLWPILKDTEIEGLNNYDFFVEECIQIKNLIVDQDCYEKGRRKILNFGHTIGHAFESLALMRNKPLLHGEAVALGIIVELEISNKILGFNYSVKERIQQFVLHNFNLFSIEDSDFPMLLELIRNDKKNLNSVISMVLLKDIGDALWNQRVEEADILSALKMYISL